MKFAKFLGICGLLAGVIGLVSCSKSEGLDGLWLGRDQESSAPTCMLELKGNQLQLFFGTILNMDTTFQVRAKIDAKVQGANEGTTKGDAVKGEPLDSEKVPIDLKSDAVYDVALHSPEDAWAKVEEFYYSGGKLYARLRYVSTDKRESIVFEPYHENEDPKLKIYKWDERKELQGNWSDSQDGEKAYFKAEIKKDHLKFYLGEELCFDGAFKIVQYLETGEMYLIDAKTKYPHLPEHILDGLVLKGSKLIVHTIVHDQGVHETELFKF